jgi:hypothetical protein
MLDYEVITLIQDVEVDKLSMELGSMIYVATYDLSHTPPKNVPLVHNGFAYQLISSSIDLEYL